MTNDTSPRKTLLIVEDELELRELVADVLAPLGLEIVPAANGREALEIIRARRVDAVLSDLKMPLMDGLQLLYEVRMLGLETPFMLLTAYGDKNSAVMALRLGAADFIEKPFDPDDLVERVGRLVEYGHRLRELDTELNELCRKADFPSNTLEQYRRAKKGILLLKKQRGR